MPRLLAAKITVEAVSFEEAAFTTVGAVALHGIRTAEAKLGDVVAVIGLGLGWATHRADVESCWVQVLGMDLSRDRFALALELGCGPCHRFGFRSSKLCVRTVRRGGTDAVIIAAETSSSDPVNLAGRVVRDRGVVVAVGTVGMDIQRKPYYEKE